MLRVAGTEVVPVSNFAQQHATACNRVCKRTQHVTSNNLIWELLANNVASVWECTGLYALIAFIVN